MVGGVQCDPIMLMEMEISSVPILRPLHRKTSSKPFNIRTGHRLHRDHCYILRAGPPRIMLRNNSQLAETQKMQQNKKEIVRDGYT